MPIAKSTGRKLRNEKEKRAKIKKFGRTYTKYTKPSYKTETLASGGKDE